MCDTQSCCVSATQLILNVRFSGEALTITCLKRDNTVLDLKNELYKLTRVLPVNQKLLGIRTENNVPIADTLPLSSIVLKPTTKIMLLGSTEEAIMEVNKPDDHAHEVVDDFDYKEEDIEIGCLPENLEKLKRRSKAYKPKKLAEFRQGKRLLVLDIDYTIFDHLTPAESALQLARPYLREFLQRAYVNYDIAVWSATSLTWILAKLGQLGIIPAHLARSFQHRLDNADNSSDTDLLDSCLVRSNSDSTTDEMPFRICLLLDSSNMISVNFSEHGIKDVKPLAVIWDNHPHWGPHNTIMLDDIRRNFIMNPQSGLRIRSYRDAHINYKHDQELLRLAHYLDLIAMREPDFRTLNHHQWDRYVSKYRHLLKRPKHHHNNSSNSNRNQHHRRHHHHQYHHSNRGPSNPSDSTELAVQDCATPTSSTPSDVQTDSLTIQPQDDQTCLEATAPVNPGSDFLYSNLSNAIPKSSSSDDQTTE